MPRPESAKGVQTSGEPACGPICTNTEEFPFFGLCTDFSLLACFLLASYLLLGRDSGAGSTWFYTRLASPPCDLPATWQGDTVLTKTYLIDAVRRRPSHAAPVPPQHASHRCQVTAFHLFSTFNPDENHIGTFRYCTHSLHSALWPLIRR